MLPNITVIGGKQYELQQKNFWTQRAMEKGFRELYVASLPKGKAYSDKGFALFVNEGLRFETREILEVAFDVLFKPLGDAPKISEVLAGNTLSEEELMAIMQSTNSFSGSSSVSGELHPKSAKPSNGSRQAKKKKA